MVDLRPLVDRANGLGHVHVRLERLEYAREDISVRDADFEVLARQPESVSISTATARISASAVGSADPKMSTFVW